MKPEPATNLRGVGKCRVCGDDIPKHARIFFARVTVTSTTGTNEHDSFAHNHCGWWKWDELGPIEQRLITRIAGCIKFAPTNEEWKALLALREKGLIRIVDRAQTLDRYLLTLLALPFVEHLRSAQAGSLPGASPPRASGDVSASAERGGR